MTFTVTFPTFPVYGTGSGQYTGTSFIIQLFLFIVQVIAYPFEYVFEGIGNGIGAGFQTMFSGLFSMVSTVYTSSCSRVLLNVLEYHVGREDYEEYQYNEAGTPHNRNQYVGEWASPREGTLAICVDC